MLPVIGMLGLMFFTWIVAMYATNRSEPRQEIRGMTGDSEKAA
jgi:hypothetical protein